MFAATVGIYGAGPPKAETMPITAAAVNHMVFAALGALIDRSAVMTRATVDDCVDYFAMISGHALTKALDIFRAVGGKDILN